MDWTAVVTQQQALSTSAAVHNAMCGRNSQVRTGGSPLAGTVTAWGLPLPASASASAQNPNGNNDHHRPNAAVQPSKMTRNSKQMPARSRARPASAALARSTVAGASAGAGSTAKADVTATLSSTRARSRRPQSAAACRKSSPAAESVVPAVEAPVRASSASTARQPSSAVAQRHVAVQPPKHPQPQRKHPQQMRRSHAQRGASARRAPQPRPASKRRPASAPLPRTTGGGADDCTADWRPPFSYKRVPCANKEQYIEALHKGSDLFTVHSTFRSAAHVAHRAPMDATDVLRQLQSRWAMMHARKREAEGAVPAVYNTFQPDKVSNKPLEPTRFGGLKNWDNERPFLLKGEPFAEFADYGKENPKPPAHERFRPRPPAAQTEMVGCHKLYNRPTDAFLAKLRCHKMDEEDKVRRRKKGMGRTMIADENRTLYI